MLFWTHKATITNMLTKHNSGNGLAVALSKGAFLSQGYIEQNTAFILLSEIYSRKFQYFFLVNAHIPIWLSTGIQIYNISFVNIYPPNSEGTTNPSTLPAIIALYQSTLEISECSFKQNDISVIRAHVSNVTLSGNLVFSNNTAILGTAFILVQGSVIESVEKIYFVLKTIMPQICGSILHWCE